MRIIQLAALDFTVYHFLLPLMKALRDQGCEVIAVCSDGPFAAKIEAEGFKLERISTARSANPFRHVKTILIMWRLFRHMAIDLVHVHTPVAGLVGRLAAVLAGVPRIAYTAHGFYFHEHMKPARRFFFISLEWLLGRFTHLLFTQSQEDAHNAGRFRLARRDGTVLAIGNGTDSQRFFPAADKKDRYQLRKKLGLDTHRIVILLACRLDKDKGINHALDALKNLSDAELWLAGRRIPGDRGEHVQIDLDRALADPILADRIRMLGYREDINLIMRAADIFILPSYREGMPRSVIEAMMSGLPVIGSHIRGIREEVIDGVSGTLVKPGDTYALQRALEPLIADAELRRRWGRAGRERALALYREEDVIARQLPWIIKSYTNV